MNTNARPVWLSDEAEILALLHAVLDRFDRQPGESRQRNVALPAEAHLSALSRMDEPADQTWALIGELERCGLLAIRKGRHGPYDPEWKGAKLTFAPESEAVLREWLQRPWTQPVMQSWRQAVEVHADAFADGGRALMNRRIVIAGRGSQEIVKAFAELKDIEGPATLRQLSACAFWGDSKILDERGDLIAALFPRLEVRERALVVSVYVPQSCRGVLFIENQDTYTAAVSGYPREASGLALVYAAGFRSTAARVRARSGALLHFAGPGVAVEQARLEQWWYDEGTESIPCWFWGDLDFAGMQILKTFRSRFAGLSAWEPGYIPMLNTLRARGGYGAAAEAGVGGQVDPVFTGCPFADSVLLPAIRELGQSDQERIVC